MESPNIFGKKHISAEGVFNNGQETGVIKKYFRYGDELKNIKLHPVIKELADLDKGIYEVFSLDGKILERSEIDGCKIRPKVLLVLMMVIMVVFTRLEVVYLKNGLKTEN